MSRWFRVDALCRVWKKRKLIFPCLSLCANASTPISLNVYLCSCKNIANYSVEVSRMRRCVAAEVITNPCNKMIFFTTENLLNWIYNTKLLWFSSENVFMYDRKMAVKNKQPYRDTQLSIFLIEYMWMCTFSASIIGQRTFTDITFVPPTIPHILQ